MKSSCFSALQNLYFPGVFGNVWRYLLVAVAERMLMTLSRLGVSGCLVFYKTALPHIQESPSLNGHCAGVENSLCRGKGTSCGLWKLIFSHALLFSPQEDTLDFWQNPWNSHMASRQAWGCASALGPSLAESRQN